MKNNPFKPGSGLYPPYFAGREREIRIFKEKLTQTISGASMHLSIIGDWASGKTSLLKRFKAIAEEEKCFVCEVITPSTDSAVIFVNNLSKAIADEIRLKQGDDLFGKIKGKLNQVAGFQVSAFGFGASLQIKEKETTPQFDLKVGLRTIWNEIKEKHKAIVLLIDDFDTITESKEKRKQIMLTLRNGLMEAIGDETRVICVVTGAKLFEQFESAHSPLVRFFEPYEIGSLERAEGRAAVLVPLQDRKVKFEKEVVDKILEVTDCYPYYLQEFCYHLFENAVNDKVNMRVFESSYTTILHDLARKIWRQKVYDMGDVALKILSLIASGYESTEEIIEKGKEKFNLTPGTTRGILSRMQSRGQIQKLKRGEYTLKDKLFGEYVKALF